MKQFRLWLPLVLIASLVLTFGLTGCSSDDDDPTGPQAEAPTLPDVDQLAFDFSFFAEAPNLAGGKAEGEYDNFFNAYLRTVFLNVATRLVMTPPVGAFALAMHTPATLQEDGSWIWVYTHAGPENDSQIRLRGALTEDGVDWELRVSYVGMAGTVDNEVWFNGSTSHEGRVGNWTFYDVEDPDQPAGGRVSWSSIDNEETLRFTSLEEESDGDTLAYHAAGGSYQVLYVDESEEATSTIRWYDDGHGSLQVPEYNNAEMACWGTDFMNTECQ